MMDYKGIVLGIMSLIVWYVGYGVEGYGVYRIVEVSYVLDYEIYILNFKLI